MQCLQAFLLTVGVIDSGNTASSRIRSFTVDDLMGVNQLTDESKEPGRAKREDCTTHHNPPI